MSNVNSTALNEVIKMATFSADSAVIDALKNGKIKTSADATQIAVQAAIRSAVGNGALQLAPEQPSMWRLSDPGTWEDES